MKKILIYLVAITEELQDYNEYYAFTDLERKRNNSQKIRLQQLKQKTEFLKFTQIQNLNFISIHLREIRKYI